MTLTQLRTKNLRCTLPKLLVLGTGFDFTERLDSEATERIVLLEGKEDQI